MKQIVKIITIISVFFIIATIPKHSYASVSWPSIQGDVKNFMHEGETEDINIDATEIISGIANLLTTIGVVAVLAGILIVSIKYFVASPDEASKLKTNLVGLVISGIVILGAFGIWRLTYRILNAINADTQGEESVRTERVQQVDRREKTIDIN